MLMNKKIRKNAGITLIALVITIVVLLILAGVSIGMLIGENGILTQVGKAKEKTDRATKIEQEQLDDVAGMMNNYEDSYNKSKGCNIPKLTTGMTPVNYNSTKGTWEKCSTENWDWEYIDQESNTTDGSEGNVGTSKWANAMTEDGSLWVWIPRYAYKITSGYHSATAGEIDVKFLVGTTNKDGDGNLYSTTYDMTVATTNGYMSDFVVHPTFTTNLEQGGWSAETTGFWVAKFEAGYSGTFMQPTSAQDSTVKYTSNLYYDLTKVSDNYYGNTVPNQTLMKYPIFKDNVYSYCMISVGDAFGLSKGLNAEGNPYGFSSTCSTHMMKNSEWGAVAYLTQSKYGRNGTEITINNFCTTTGNSDVLQNNNSKFLIKTGRAGNSVDANRATNINDTFSYESPKGQLASTTGNIYGIYDLSGGCWEYVSAYEEKYDTASDFINEYGSYLVSESNKKYKEILSFNPTQTTQGSAWATHNNIFGDAMWETTYRGNEEGEAWNGDYSYYPYSVGAFVTRGGSSAAAGFAGVSAFEGSRGYLANASGFRACVVSPD